MSSRRGATVWTCDCCGAEREGGDYTHLTPDGWRAMKFGDLRWDFCPSCASSVLRRVRVAIAPEVTAPMTEGPYR